MGKKNINLVLVGFFILTAGSCAVFLIVSGRHSNAKVVARTHPLAPVTVVKPSAALKSGQGGDSNPAATPESFPFPSADATVPDQTLLRLCAMVNIANSVNEPPDIKAWHDALPVAQKLLSYPCDCAQRNWLSRFVEMGNYALNGSQTEYNASAQVLVTLGRNNDQAVALSRAVR